jgi:ferredoxin-NADP reductase
MENGLVSMEESLKNYSNNVDFLSPLVETLIGYCGPAGFNKTVEELLTKLGYSKDMIYKF